MGHGIAANVTNSESKNVFVSENKKRSKTGAKIVLNLNAYLATKKARHFLSYRAFFCGINLMLTHVNHYSPIKYLGHIIRSFNEQICLAACFYLYDFRVDTFRDKVGFNSVCALL